MSAKGIVAVHMGWPCWVGVVAEDLDAQRRFYRDVLGWPNWPPARAGSSSISAKRVYSNSSSAAASLSTTRRAARSGMRSPTFESARGQLVCRGVQQVTEIEGDAQAGGRWCYCRDAEGNIFEIKERHEQRTR
jgi:catechol 2,3-dioxygenase-like lactoylglutathione lyase family enzyme